jgi:heme/copper-type cytochrome/quinol oxidase subunit 2
MLQILGLTVYICIAVILYRNLLRQENMVFLERLASFTLALFWPVIPVIIFVILIVTSSKFQSTFDDLFD